MSPASSPAKTWSSCSCVSGAMGSLLCDATHPTATDPLPFDLAGWQPVADEVRKHLKAMNGRNEDLTEIPEAA